MPSDVSEKIVMCYIDYIQTKNSLYLVWIISEFNWPKMFQLRTISMFLKPVISPYPRLAPLALKCHGSNSIKNVLRDVDRSMHSDITKQLSPLSVLVTQDGKDRVKDTYYSMMVPMATAAGVVVLSGSEDEEEADDNGPGVNQEEGTPIDVENNNPIDLEDNVEVVTMKRKRAGQSPVWDFAERVSVDKVRCNVCKLAFKCPVSNTSNIRDHLLNKHRGTKEAEELVAKINEKSKAKKMKENKKDKPCSIKQFFNADQLPNKIKEELDKCLVEFIICENKSFESVESHFFRKLMFTANNGYIMPSRRTLTRKVDDKIVQVKKDLKEEILKDIASLKTISITSDGGNSGDIYKTKKNTITVSRVTDNFELKTDTVGVPVAKGSQEGIVIRSQWKEELLKIGYTTEWSVNATTDGASNFRSARAPGRHAGVGLQTKYATDCVDHQIHLLVEESLKGHNNIKDSLKKGKKLVNHFSRSCLSRQLVRSIQVEVGLPKLCPIVGTANRWFHKMSEIERLLEMKVAIEVFQERVTTEVTDEDDVPIEDIEDSDWVLMQEYVDAVKPFQIISKFLGGEKYPAGCCVIPALDQIKEDMENVRTGSSGEELIKTMLTNFEKRFPNCWKLKTPFNCLTFLDPRSVDMYAETVEVLDRIRSDISSDGVYDNVLSNHEQNFLYQAIHGVIEPTQTPPAEASQTASRPGPGPSTPLPSTSRSLPSTSNPGPSSPGPSTSFQVPSTSEQDSSISIERSASSPSVSSRRAALLAKKRTSVPENPPMTFFQKLDAEIDR